MNAAKILSAVVAVGLACALAPAPSAAAPPSRATLAQLLDEVLSVLPRGQAPDDVVTWARARLTERHGEGHEAEYAILGEVSRFKRTLIAFNGKDRRLDRSVAAGHFVHGNDESALVWRPSLAPPTYFLFHHGRLWKVVRPLAVTDPLTERIKTLATRLGAPTEIQRGEDGAGGIAQVQWQRSHHLVRLIEPPAVGEDALLVLEETKLARGVDQAREALAYRAANPVVVSDELREFLMDPP